MKTANKFLALAILTFTSLSSAFAGQTYEELAYGDLVHQGTTIAGQIIKIADGDTWVKSARRAKIGDTYVELTGVQQTPGVAILSLVLDGNVVARRVINTNEPKLVEGQFAPRSCVFSELDIGRMAALTDEVLCGGIKAIPRAAGITLDIDRLEVGKSGYMRDLLILDSVVSTEADARLVAAEATKWIYSPRDKSVRALLPTPATKVSAK